MRSRRVAIVVSVMVAVMMLAQTAFAAVSLPWNFGFNICCRIPESHHFVDWEGTKIFIDAKASTNCNASSYNITVWRAQWGPDKKVGSVKWTEGVQGRGWYTLGENDNEHYMEIWRDDFHNCGRLIGKGTVNP